MEAPTIKDAKEVCRRLGADAVIILAFNVKEDEVRGASYGRNAALCSAFEEVHNELMALFELGEVEIPL